MLLNIAKQFLRGMVKIYFWSIKNSGEILKGIYLSKALTCMKIFLYKQELLFVKETDTLATLLYEFLIHLT